MSEEAAQVDEKSEYDHLVEDNETLTKWVVGILEGCEGCIAEAKGWIERAGITHEDGTPIEYASISNRKSLIGRVLGH